MAEKAPLSLLLWQAWALLGVLAAAVSGARLAAGPSVAMRRPTAVVSVAAATRGAGRAAASPVEGAAPFVDRTLARLRIAQASTELCELLARLTPSEELAATYAITEVLERNQLRSVRECGAQALSRQPTPAAQSWLIDLAEDPDPDVHGVALDALAAHGDSSGQNVIIEATHSDDTEIRIAAVMALLKARRAEAFPAAKAALPSIGDRDTALALVDALGQSHDARALPVLGALIAQGERQIHLHAIAALGALGQESGAPLLGSFLEIGSKEEFLEAARALLKLTPDSALTTLSRTLHTGDAERSRLSLSVIVGVDLPGVMPLLSEELRSGNPTLASIVLRRLERRPNPALEGELTELLKAGDPGLQRPVMRALARLGTAGAIAALKNAPLPEGSTDWASTELEQIPELGDALRARRLAAFEKAGDRRALRALARDPSPSVQASLIAHFSGREQNPLQLSLVLASAPSSTVEHLVRGASSLGTEQRRALVDGLAQRADPRFAEVLQNATRDPDDAIRHNAIQALVALGDGSASSLVDALARATDPLDRAFAAELLGTRIDQAALRQLEALGSDPNEQVLSAALSALQTRSPELTAKLALHAYQSATAEDRAGLLSSFSGLNGTLLRPVFDLALQDDATATDAINSLSALAGPESAARLVSVLTNSGRAREVRVAAAEALHTLGGPLARSNRALIDALTRSVIPGGGREPRTPEPYLCEPKNL